MNMPLLLILAVFALVCAAPVLANDDRRDRPPNIVLIIGDDYGYPYAGFMGDEFVETPNLDRLAEEGTTFTHAFSSASVCRPALQTLLTGLHPRSWVTMRNRIEDAIGEPIQAQAEVPYYVTLPRQLARQGYRSFQGGKHWEGDFAMAGFDAGTATSFTTPFNTGLFFGRPSLSPMYDFLDELEEDEHFFLFLAPLLPHTPFDPSPELIARYEAKGLSAAAVLYYANITRLDEVIGRIVAALEDRGLRDDSLIIYVSDNGWEQGPFDSGNILGGDRGKLSIHELGFRTPLIFNWPGKVLENERLNDLVTFEDLHATLLHYASAPIPPDHEGITLIPRIEGWGEPVRDHVIGAQDVLVRGFRPRAEAAAFLRTDRWRYIEWLDRGQQALYHIEEDPFERNNVGAEHPEMLALFAARTSAWRDALAQPAPWMDLMGRLTAEDDTPAAGLRLWLEGADESGSPARLEVFSDDRGFFRFPNVPAGEYTLTYEIEARAFTGRWRRVRTPPVTRSVEVDLIGYETGPFLSLPIPGAAPPAQTIRSRPGTIEIELLAQRGAETSGLPVWVGGWTSHGFVEQRVLSGPDGFVAVDQLPAGFYLIRVSPHAGVHAQTRYVHLRPGVNELLKIELSPGRVSRHERSTESIHAVPAHRSTGSSPAPASKSRW